MTINQSVTIKTTAENAYRALTSAREFSEATGAPADIAGDEGGAFSCFGGKVVGRQIELLPNARIVQAWRVGAWPEGRYSIAKFEIREAGGATTVNLEHSGYPDGSRDHLEGGWSKMYWEPLKAYLE
ncbi:MAG: SRPBCC domain-containing protein [Hyphomicrobiaceae bacterium]